VISPSVAVVIVNWNSREDLLEAVGSLQRQSDPAVDICVVDNGSEDGSVAAIRREYPSVIVVEAGENLGFAEGCNRGIAVTRSDWVFVLNNDAIATPECIARLRKAARQAPPDVGMIQPCIVFRADPSRVNSSGVVVFRSGAARDRHFDEPVGAALEPGEVFCPTGGAALYRRSMLEQVRLPSGYFDRRFFMYYEDVDLGWRCRLVGWRAVYLPQVVVVHRFQGSSVRRGRRFAEQHCQMNRISSLLRNASLRMIAHSLPWTLRDLFRLSVANPLALWRLTALLPGTLRERAQVERMRTLRRKQVEKRWMDA
jgi:GT2 family glycosyltransferase